MEIIFECEDKKGAELYKEIITDALRLHSTFFRKIYVFINIKEPLFIINVSWTNKPKLVLKEIANIETHPEGVKIRLNEENKHHAKELFTILKSVYGEEYIYNENNGMIIRDAKPQDLKQFLTDFNEKTINSIIDTFYRILPEAFKVIHVLPNHDGLTLICSENPIKTEWIEKAKKITLKS